MFEVYLIAVGLGALKTALDVTGPWYGGTATFWAYFTSFIGGLVLIGVLLLSALLLVRTKPPASVFEVSTSPGTSTAKSTPDGTNVEMDKLLHSLDQTAGLGTRPKGGAATFMETSDVRIARTVAAPAVSRRPHPRSPVGILLGPTVPAALFAAISAALLPASEGFLQTNFAINTFVILVFAYGWGGLIAYAVASILLAARGR